MKNENQQLQIPELIVTPLVSNKKPGTVIARIRNQLCFFETDVPFPTPGVPVSVMITRCLYRKSDDGYYDFTKVMALVLRVVTDEHMLVHHHGFENEGSMCRTTAMTSLRFSGDKLDGVNGICRTLTPGRTGIFVADNHNVDWNNSVNRTYGDGKKQQEREPRRPGVVYVRKCDMQQAGTVRIEGLVRPEDGEFAAYLQR